MRKIIVVLSIICLMITMLSLSTSAVDADYSYGFESDEHGGVACGYNGTTRAVSGAPEMVYEGTGALRMKSDTVPCAEGRRPYLIPASIKAGTYELKFWLCDQSKILNNKRSPMEYYITFHNLSTVGKTNTEVDAIEESLHFMHQDTDLTPYKFLLFNPKTGQGLMQKTGEADVANGVDWVEYSCVIKLDTDVSSMSFWIMQDEGTLLNQFLYIDNLTMTKTDKPLSTSPEITTSPDTTESQNTTVVDTTVPKETTEAKTSDASDDTKPNETKPYVTSIAEENESEDEKTNLVPFIIIGAAVVIVAAVIVISKKIKSK